jgi:hypothetical protein
MGNAHPTKRFTSVAPLPEEPPAPDEGCRGFIVQAHGAQAHEIEVVAGDADAVVQRAASRRAGNVQVRTAQSRGSRAQRTRFVERAQVSTRSDTGKLDWAEELEHYLATGDDAGAAKQLGARGIGWGGAVDPVLPIWARPRGMTLDELLARAQSMPATLLRQSGEEERACQDLPLGVAHAFAESSREHTHCASSDFVVRSPAWLAEEDGAGEIEEADISSDRRGAARDVPALVRDRELKRMMAALRKEIAESERRAREHDQMSRAPTRPVSARPRLHAPA